MMGLFDDGSFSFYGFRLFVNYSASSSSICAYWGQQFNLIKLKEGERKKDSYGGIDKVPPQVRGNGGSDQKRTFILLER